MFFQNDIRLIIVFAMIFAASIIGYSLVIFFGFKINQKLKSNETQMTEKTMVLNKQLQKTLIIQVSHFNPFLMR